MSHQWRKVLMGLVLSLILLINACAANPPSPYEKVQKETTQRGAPSAVAKTAESGGTFNKFFPKTVKGYEIIPTQEKKGFAEYKVNKDGKTVAMLSINDTSSIPSAAAKYQNSSLKVAGNPVVEQGASATGMLVNNRYQIKVLSRDPSFTSEDRLAWLEKFDVKGLAKLKGASENVTLSPAQNVKPSVPSRPVLSPQPAT